MAKEKWGREGHVPRPAHAQPCHLLTVIIFWSSFLINDFLTPSNASNIATRRSSRLIGGNSTTSKLTLAIPHLDTLFATVLATTTIANIVQARWGPWASTKCWSTIFGEVAISNDGTIILSMLAVGHPAEKIFVDLGRKKDKEVGTTSVVIVVAGKRVRQGENPPDDDHH
ncbi:hypothetical protein HYPSUDRAFT_209016 [Hypholoma sublateritium FD-334 SS-4]|uniref:Uncharacterized protein n=1 Tax=Hypholoma sublateritium (strain FD-334 SS-4) TaxID=945553 RepID=A0A0D2LTB5_HYPSF|nr:hypothetical protein HYPSUDRAFT_209016 [Hypholoma sublateritium FD-334 SS-4]